MGRRAVVVAAVRTPIGSYGGVISSLRPDDLAAIVIRALIERTGIDPAIVDDVYFGAANQAGEDNRNVARMAVLLAGLPETVPGATVNRLCASSLDAINIAARMIEANHGDVMIAGIDFGCGSSREHAPIAIMGAGVSCVIAKSFARIFFRNSINLGLPVLESPEAADAIEQGDEIDVDLATGTIRNLTTEQVFTAKPFEPFMMDIIEAGGLVEYTKRKLAAGAS